MSVSFFDLKVSDRLKETFTKSNENSSNNRISQSDVNNYDDGVYFTEDVNRHKKMNLNYSLLCLLQVIFGINIGSLGILFHQTKVVIGMILIVLVNWLFYDNL